jgi:hypothetical protein
MVAVRPLVARIPTQYPIINLRKIAQRSSQLRGTTVASTPPPRIHMQSPLHSLTTTYPLRPPQPLLLDLCNKRPGGVLSVDERVTVPHTG